MRIVCVGGGPAGLYFAIAVKRRDAGHDVTVMERDPPGATYGWGVVYWDDMLDMLYEVDPESGQEIRAASSLWQQQAVRLRGTDTAYFHGYGYSVGRSALLEILTGRARDLGVDVQHRRRVADLSDISDADLVIACDGANSRVRQMHGDHFGTQLHTGRNPYIWLGTDRVFPSFVFDFHQSDAGWIWCHAYPSSEEISTFIVECSPETWEGLGLGSLSSEDGLRLLEEIFAPTLGGASLFSQSRGVPAPWLNFTEVRNATWYHDNVVLMGDAAHTTHFTIGSGTRLAMIDAVQLAMILHRHGDVPAALETYDKGGHAAHRRPQARARTSMAWFESVDRYLDRDAVEFSYAMATRSGSVPPWRYQLHRARQVPALRRMWREWDSGRRWLGARRRGERPRAWPQRIPLHVVHDTPTTGPSRETTQTGDAREASR
jgi:2-polyprenyl-6-methoxyphenol hydroxylase-like FAD-dependent oxidoreductase